MAGKKLSDVGVVIAAGGTGTRMGARLPKQFLRIAGGTILERTLFVFDRHPMVSEIVVVTPRAWIARTRRLVRRAGFRHVTVVVAGGKERQDSVWNGLRAFTRPPSIVLVHDAARPFATKDLITAVIRETARFNAAVPGIEPGDTIALEGKPGFYGKTFRRSALRAVQTPQGFAYDLLTRAHEAARRDGFLGTDDSSLVQRMGASVRIVPGEAENVKITTKGDLRAGRLRNR